MAWLLLSAVSLSISRLGVAHGYKYMAALENNSPICRKEKKTVPFRYTYGVPLSLISEHTELI